MENAVCAILALHLRSRHLLSGGNLITSWLDAPTAEDLRGEHWLLIYEGVLRKGWPISSGSAAAVDSDGFFAAMKSENVSFYDSRAYNRPLNLPGIELHLRRALGERKRALLRGAIMVVRKPFGEEGDYEELGADYGDDNSFFNPFFRPNDDEEDVPL
jgi:hypothetical protein